MIIAAFASFIALIVVWALSPDRRPVMVVSADTASTFIGGSMETAEA